MLYLSNAPLNNASLMGGDTELAKGIPSRGRFRGSHPLILQRHGTWLCVGTQVPLLFFFKRVWASPHPHWKYLHPPLPNIYPPSFGKYRKTYTIKAVFKRHYSFTKKKKSYLLLKLGIRVLRGKVFGTPNRYCPVIFCPDKERTEK